MSKITPANAISFFVYTWLVIFNHKFCFQKTIAQRRLDSRPQSIMENERLIPRVAPFML
jgi:hypothetical protein